MEPHAAATASTFALVKAALAEDIGPGDLTSLACLEPDPVHARVIAKCDGVLSGLVPFMLTFEIVDSANVVRPLLHDGDSFKTGDTVIEIDGFNQTVLASERVALNFLGRLSGIASLTHRFVERIGDHPCTVLDTRKTTPGWRQLEKDAVRHGGGGNQFAPAPLHRNEPCLIPLDGQLIRLAF